VFIGAAIDGYPRLRCAHRRRAVEGKIDAAHSIPSTYLGKDGSGMAVPAGGGGFLRSPTSDVVIAWRVQ
jgi:hypothetical protein